MSTKDIFPTHHNSRWTDVPPWGPSWLFPQDPEQLAVFRLSFGTSNSGEHHGEVDLVGGLNPSETY